MSFLNLSSEIAKTFAFTYRNVTMTKRNVFLLGDMLYWPFIAVLSIGFMLAYLQIGTRDAAVVLSGVVAMSVLQPCQLDVSYVLLFDMWSKSMKHTLVAPVGRRHYIVGAWLFGMFRGTVTFMALVALIRWLFKFDILQAGIGPTIVFLSGLFLSGLFIGLLIIILLYSFGMRAEIAAWSIVSVLMIVCGIYYPVEILPPAARMLGQAIPLTWFLDAFRQAFGLRGHEHAALKGYALSAVYMAGLYMLVMLSEKRARRRGTILKMSE